MSFRKIILFIFAVIFFLFFSSLVVQAQVQGKVRGMVTDAQGNPLEKVAVTIISVKSVLQRYEVTTGKDGKFAQIGIQPGYYQVICKKDGFAPRTMEVHVEIASDTNLEVKLETADQVAMKSLSAADNAFLKATNLYNNQKFEEAVAGFGEAIKLNPDNWAYYFNLGLTYKKLNKTTEARGAFGQAVELNPESFSANKEMGELLAKEGDFAGAAEYYKKAVAVSPSDPDGHYNLGACLVNLGQSEEAFEHFQKTIELKPDYAEAYFQLGSLYINQNKTKEAVTSLEKFIQLAPQHEKAALARQLLEYLKKLP